MRKIAFSLLFLALFSWVKAQSITESKDWDKLLTALDNEKWPEANKLSLDCLKKLNDSGSEPDIAAILRYMVIYSEAGMMNEDHVSQEDALKAVKAFKGMPVTLPGHPIDLKKAFNSVRMVNGKTDSLFITATNKAATEIFSFEYTILKGKWPIEDFKGNAGKMFRLSGTLSEITVEGHMLPRFRLIINDGQYEKMED